MEPIYSPVHIWIGCNVGMSDFEWFTDMQEDAEHADVEYIRKDKYDELKKASDELAMSADSNNTSLSSLGLTESLAAYRKATV